ncbi:hypothetical protein [Frondihabitans australicus]|uniref:Capsular polysaccharide biosynthesis protein n=1 Tax=Frondihabitans australicus TaxID=386892 RepID=A0A495IFV9_9MICO|nr:hypothetical protein [Frondihabitans australicus]RKR74221.1 hypothetical protein C8E83_1329 [Frondihabitans australicus]
MNTPLTLVDVLAQLRRRWTVVAGGAVIGLLVGIAAGTPNPSAVVVVLAAIVGAAAGFFAAFTLVKLHPRVTKVDDIRRVTGLPVIAQLPAAVIDPDLGPEGYDDRASTRRMRTTLREAVMNTRSLAGGDLPRRLVLARTDTVSEASGVDGGLARALVESGFATAVLDTDLENRLESRPSSVDQSPLGEDAPRTAPAGYVREPVPDRVIAARPADRLARVDELLGVLGDRYDVTVAGAASDSQPVPLRALAPAADAVIIVARSNRTTVESLLAMYGELLGMGVEPIGVILTGVAARHRVLLRSTWTASDFRAGVVATDSPARDDDVAEPPAPATSEAAVQAPTPSRRSPKAPTSPVVVTPLLFDDEDDDLDLGMPRLAGFSIADLVERAGSGDGSSGGTTARSLTRPLDSSEKDS